MSCVEHQPKPGGLGRILVFLFASATLSLAQSPASGRDRLPDPVRPEVEALYRKGLNYLIGAQTPEGCWQDRYGRFPGVVGLTMMAILAHGEDPNHGPYHKHLKRALDFLLKKQNTETGYIGDSMYNHGFATVALAECYGSIDDDRLGPALKKATELILTAQSQNPRFGWRYRPESKDADTTVSGAQMVALFAARNAGIGVPDDALDRGLAFFSSCQSPGGGFGYSSPGSPNVPRTAIGVLVFALAHQNDAPGLDQSFRYLTQDLDYRDQNYPFYYEYYMAQALFQVDPAMWKAWDERNVIYLTENQSEDGSWDGSNGPTFATAAALLSTALNYRFLPIYER